MIKLNIQRFSSTNKTTHYDLSQYVSSDLPTYLVDYNSDMSKIDTGINAAQTTADTASTAATNAQTAAETAQGTANTAVTNAATADTKATTANTNIGTMANLETVNKNDLVSAINEVNTIANTSQVIDSLSGSETTKAPSVRVVKEQFEEVELFSSDNGSLGQNITLSQSANNFERLEVVVGTAYYKETIEIRPHQLGSASPNVPIYYIWHDGTSAMGIFAAWYTLSGNTLTYNYATRLFAGYGSTDASFDSNNQVNVFKVYGYRQ